MYVSLNLYATDSTSNGFRLYPTVPAVDITVWLFLHESRPNALGHPLGSATSESFGARGWTSKKEKRVAEG
jgi:hypothetical protein